MNIPKQAQPVLRCSRTPLYCGETTQAFHSQSTPAQQQPGAAPVHWNCKEVEKDIRYSCMKTGNPWIDVRV